MVHICGMVGFIVLFLISEYKGRIFNVSQLSLWFATALLTMPITGVRKGLPISSFLRASHHERMLNFTEHLSFVSRDGHMLFFSVL